LASWKYLVVSHACYRTLSDSRCNSLYIIQNLLENAAIWPTI